MDKRSKLPLGGAADRGGVVEGEQKGGEWTAPAEGPAQLCRPNSVARRGSTGGQIARGRAARGYQPLLKSKRLGQAF